MATVVVDMDGDGGGGSRESYWSGYKMETIYMISTAATAGI